MEGQEYGSPLAPACGLIVLGVMEHLLAEIFVKGKCRAVHAAPEHEVEARTVPKPAEEHGDDEVHVLPNLSLAVAAKRNVDVVAYPGRERDVPAAPKVGDAGAAVGGVEVDGEVETQLPQRCSL